MRHVAALVGLIAGTAAADTTPAPFDCTTSGARVHGVAPERAALVCDHVKTAAERFAACHLPAAPEVDIFVLDEMESHCVGRFHCGENRIEVLSPEALELRRPKMPIFGHLPAERVFSSVILHEYAHALFDGTPCPYDSCIATSEYFSYTQQIAALTPAERAPIEARIDPGTRPPRELISTIMLLFSPDHFITASWAHFRTRPDACTYWQRMIDGAIVFDEYHP